MVNFKNELITVTSKKFGTMFCDYAKHMAIEEGMKVGSDSHCSFKEDTTRVSIKSARAIKKSNQEGYLANLLHSNEYCSIDSDKFDVIIQQIQWDNFDKLKFFVCFDEGIYFYTIPTMTMLKYRDLLKFSGKQHSKNGETSEGQFHLTQSNISAVNDQFNPVIIDYNEVYKVFKNK